MKFKDVIEHFVKSPQVMHGGSINAALGVASISLREENGGWALYSYRTCIARRDDNFRMWVTTKSYTATTSKQLGALHLFLSQSRSFAGQVMMSDADPETEEAFGVMFDRCAELGTLKYRGENHG